MPGGVRSVSRWATVAAVALLVYLVARPKPAASEGPEVLGPWLTLPKSPDGGVWM